MDDLTYCVSLSLVKGVGPARFKMLIRQFGSPMEVFRADFVELRKLIHEKIVNEIKNFDFSVAEDILRKTEVIDARIVCEGHAEYPEKLRPYNYSPPVIWVKGDISGLNGLTIGVVGTRRPTPYGIRMTRRIVEALVEAGFTIVSGGAYGIDTVAHRTAIDSGGKTVAILGSGLDVPYPWRNRRLFDEITGLISEYPPGTGPNAENFPRRNRIISALSDAIVVIEAGKSSGALLTARWALDQGKEIFALPGPVDSDKSQGTNRLIREGAKIVTEIDDILEEFGLHYEKSRKVDLGEKEKRVYDRLGGEPVHIDKLLKELDMDVTELLGILLNLELKGLVQQIPGKYFVKL